MRYILLYFLLVGSQVSVQAQVSVVGELETTNDAALHIVQIIPDTFPEVSLIFRAVDGTGRSFWNLKKEDTQIREDGIDCNIKSLYPITFPKPVHVSVVLDHSGSMGMPVWLIQDTALLEKIAVTPALWESIIDTISTPLKCAQQAMVDFIGSFDLEKDRVALTAFDHQVNVSEPLSKDTARLFRQVRELQPVGATAFYDATISGLEHLQDTSALNVLVALTDGADNESRSDLDSVIALASRRNIPVYTIGLGGAHRQVLQKLSTSTKGASYFTDDPQQLTKIYSEIRENIQAYYQLTYHSPTITANAMKRDVDLQILFQGHDVTASMSYELPDEVVDFLREKEAQLAAEERQQKLEERRWIWGGGGSAVLLALGAVLYFRSRRKEQEPTVRNVWPVPTQGELYIDLSKKGGSVVFEDTARAIRKSYRMNIGVNRFDLGAIPPGNYTATITVGEEVIVKRFVKV